MFQNYNAEHFTDHNGKPAGGHTYGVGFAIAWQNGPLGRGDKRKKPNGAFVESIIHAAKQRIEWYNMMGFECEENNKAIAHLEAALKVLDDRTNRREDAGVEGTHEGK
jgi:hypothetical protein